MNDRPLVSIVTPSYNQAKYLPDTIHSVLRQDYPDLEYGIVDGGSTDSSLEIIEEHGDQLDWWISEPDQGQSDAINKGLARTRGSILAWINSDDIYMPGAIRKAVEVFEAHDPDMVFGDAITIDAEGIPLNTLKFGQWGLKELMRFRVICQPAVFLKREVWEALGGLDQSYHFMLDHHLWIRTAAEYNIRHSPQVMAASRYHHEAKNVAQAPGFSEEIFRLRGWMSRYPETAEAYQRDERRILGGAFRLSARYLLDGGLTKRALGEYLKAVWNWPSFGLKHGHRILFAIASLVTGVKMSAFKRKQKPLRMAGEADLEGWPGLTLRPSGR